MTPTDATTLLLVVALVNGMAALVWGLLAGLFRIAPQASLLLAGAHLLSLPALLGSWCLAPLRPAFMAGWMPPLAGVLVMGLLSLALRRLLRLPGRGLAPLLLTAAGLALVLVGQQIGQTRLLASLGMAALLLLSLRDLLVGAGGGLPKGLALGIGLPLAGLALASLLRALSWSADRCATSTPLAWAWLVLSLLLTVSLLVLVLQRLVARIEHLTLSDPLTGVLNRRGLAARQAQLQAQAGRGHGYAVLLIDVDHFKRINDGLGHAAGDAALCHVVAGLRQGLRELDLLGRLGGEEFCALLPHTGLPEAAAVAERMRVALQRKPFVWRDARLQLSASFGVAAASEEQTGEQLLAAADAALYRAKQQGRDRVCLADTEAEG